MKKKLKLNSMENIDQLRVNRYEGTSFNYNRSLKEYESFLNFKIDELKGQRILDLGSGLGERFAKSASRHGINIVSLNPEYKQQSARKTAKTGLLPRLFICPDWKKELVSGISQKLPFQDKSFDQVFCLYSIPGYLYFEDFEPSFNEIIRVLKDGGIARIFPIMRSIHENPDFWRIVDRIREKASVDFKEDETPYPDNHLRMIITKKRP